MGRPFCGFPPQISFTASPAIIRPITGGTKATLPGMGFPSPSSAAGMGGSVE